jgi:four helix bundle protein
MLRVYSDIIAFLRRLRPIITKIEAHDRDLARQLRRCASSIAHNCAEASGSRGGTRKERYLNALGSARETGACVDVALALGYVEHVEPELLEMLDGIRAVLAPVTK